MDRAATWRVIVLGVCGLAACGGREGLSSMVDGGAGNAGTSGSTTSAAGTTMGAAGTTMGAAGTTTGAAGASFGGGNGGANGASTCAVEPSPATVGPGKVIALTAGLLHVCALFDQGSVACWGSNDYGQLGIGRGCVRQSLVPLRVRNVTDAVAISAGMLHTCALLKDGSVKCWGEQPPGIADSTCPTDPAIDSNECVTIAGAPSKMGTTPGVVPGSSGMTAISGGNHFDCAVAGAGEVRCWGDQAYGELGNGSPASAELSTPVKALGVGPAIGVASGLFHGCAALADGTAACWGDNSSGEVGDGTTAMAVMPTPVAKLAGVTSVVASSTAGSPSCAACYAFSCALLSNGTVACWGSGQDGELGDGQVRSDATTEPVLVPGVSKVRSLVAGPGKVLAIGMDGTLTAWGSDRCGELGDGRMVNAGRPVVVSGLDHIASAASTSCSTCALRDDGTAWCWGSGGAGELGDGLGLSSLVPVVVAGL
jgi:alpha-tubulin suppressor-like RCC1 family protein